MTRFLPLLLLAGCCSLPYQPDTFERIRAEYIAASARMAQACEANQGRCDKLRTAQYNAAAALTEAAGDGCKLATARRAVAAFAEAERL